MRVLVACEYSGAVRDAFIARGHGAVSCDLLPSDKGGPHYQGDMFDIIGAGWDMLIAFPPCTYLTVTGNRWFRPEYAERFPDRAQQREEALDFVRRIMAVDVPRIAVENPVGIISTRIRKPDQIIQPWQFGHEASKKTCLWLKGLPKLVPTKVVGRGEYTTYASGKRIPTWYANAGGAERWKIRSATFPGVAAAMAEQWGSLDD